MMFQFFLFNCLFVFLFACMKTIPGDTDILEMEACQTCTEEAAKIITDDLSLCPGEMNLTCQETDLNIPTPLPNQCTEPLLLCPDGVTTHLAVEIEGTVYFIPANDIGMEFDYICENNVILTGNPVGSMYPDGTITKAACASKPCATCEFPTADTCSIPGGNCIDTLDDYDQTNDEADGYCTKVTIDYSPYSYIEYTVNGVPTVKPPMMAEQFSNGLTMTCNAMGAWELASDNEPGVVYNIGEFSMYQRPCSVCARSLTLDDASFCLTADYECISGTIKESRISDVDGCQELIIACPGTHSAGIYKNLDGSVEPFPITDPVGIDYSFSCDFDGTAYNNNFNNKVEAFLCAKPN